MTFLRPLVFVLIALVAAGCASACKSKDKGCSNCGTYVAPVTVVAKPAPVVSAPAPVVQAPEEPTTVAKTSTERAMRYVKK
ncbi:MAG TPA: hypothetical protein PK997_05045 [Candidatus Omnitrophota bacterium]|jgi:apolipoprotein N-acyltransferase|nr:MAG: hypothetical protein BWY49_00712 [Candidatus Omnitrophica bacterium ADurb.Bin314]HOE68474.1 hypothetical protein [Candidatus Omnitrophota bacterium]HQB94561.1 hypothetical protein [Candidatus Omnitrophota bacterium]